MKYADDLVLLAKEEKVLQGTAYKLTETGRCYGMDVDVDVGGGGRGRNFRGSRENHPQYRL